MRLILFTFVSMFVLAALSGCGKSSKELTARGTPGQPGTPTDQKPTDPHTGKYVENSPLQTMVPQYETPTDESGYKNILQLTFGDAQMAWYSFELNPQSNGVFYFVKRKSVLHPETCTKDPAIQFHMRVVWQEKTANQRKILKELNADEMTSFVYSAGKSYVLSYVLTDLRGDFADCKSATFKFAPYFPTKLE
jgi:hypothetical protein